jgi:hypothetical protein
MEAYAWVAGKIAMLYKVQTQPPVKKDAWTVSSSSLFPAGSRFAAVE